MKVLSVVLIVGLSILSADAELRPAKESVLSRFLRYVKIDTQSKEDQTIVPSTKKQFDLANLLAR